MTQRPSLMTHHDAHMPGALPAHVIGGEPLARYITSGGYSLLAQLVMDSWLRQLAENPSSPKPVAPSPASPG